MELIISPWNSPTRNCALEAYMVTERPGDVLLLYINTPSVIVGRHQTIEAEIDTAFCRTNGIEVVRRLSGGGAVYHDRGNINYAFITDKGNTPVLDRDFAAPILTALQTLGIEATSGARRELLCQGYKISGTASHVTRSRQLFHGTLLYQTDLSVLSRALSGRSELRGKGVASVPSPVANIAELYSRNESPLQFLEVLSHALSDYYAVTHFTELSISEVEQVARLEQQLYPSALSISE